MGYRDPDGIETWVVLAQTGIIAACLVWMAVERWLWRRERRRRKD